MTRESFLPIRSPGALKALRLDEVGLVMYVGCAGAGTLGSAAEWQIKRLTDSGAGALTIEWADGNCEFDNVWDNRASLSYS